MQRHNVVQFTRGTRIKAVEAGIWPKSDGTLMPVRKMPDGHLVNALLKELALGCDRSATVVRVLGAEVLRRNLRDYALAVAAEREERSHR